MPTLRLPADDRPVAAPRVIAGCRGPSSRSYRDGWRSPQHGRSPGRPKNNALQKGASFTESQAHGIPTHPLRRRQGPPTTERARHSTRRSEWCARFVASAVAQKLESNSGIRIGVRVVVLAECTVDSVGLDHGVVGLGANSLGSLGLGDRGCRQHRGDGQRCNHGLHDKILPVNIPRNMAQACDWAPRGQEAATRSNGKTQRIMTRSAGLLLERGAK